MGEAVLGLLVTGETVLDLSVEGDVKGEELSEAEVGGIVGDELAEEVGADDDGD
jgi:ribosome biogenesis SPOUT family RNA methylase Rps3